MELYSNDFTKFQGGILLIYKRPHQVGKCLFYVGIALFAGAAT